jgi:SAM-dependent methyltransferase
MGLGVAFLREIIDLKSAGKLDRAARVVEIGAQQLADNFLGATDELRELYRLFGREPVDLGAPVGVENFRARAPTARQFWTSLGLEYAAVDLVDDAIRIDLNREQVPAEMRDRFDIVTNGGTTEHVANQDNTFRVIHDLCRPGGLMIHEVPCQAMMTHGLINYNPKFFSNLARANAYEIVSMRVCADGPCDLPAEVMQVNAEFGGGYVIPEQHRILQGFTIRATLKKIDSRAFETPIDYRRTLAARGLSLLSRKLRIKDWNRWRMAREESADWPLSRAAAAIMAGAARAASESRIAWFPT